MRIGIVVNPRARGASDPELPARLRALCAQAGVDCQVVVAAQAAALPPLLAELGATPLDVLGICGGDGTLMTTLSAFAQATATLPALLLLPAGTMNTVAKNLGLVPRPEALLAALLDTLTRRGLPAVPSWPQETLRVTTYGETPHTQTAQADVALDEASLHTLPQRERYGFVFSGAMGARFLAAYSSVPEPGLRWALLLALRTIASCLYPGGGKLARWLFQPTPTQLYIDDDERVEAAFRLLLLSTVADVGLGMRVPWRAGRLPGRFHLIASGISTLENALQLPRIWRGQPLRGRPHYDRLARSAELRFTSPQALVLDGELFCAPAVDVELGPQLQVLRPALAGKC